MEKKLDVNKVHEIGVNISNLCKQVSKLANELMTLYPNNISLLKVYALFLKDIMNNT